MQAKRLIHKKILNYNFHINNEKLKTQNLSALETNRNHELNQIFNRKF